MDTNDGARTTMFTTTTTTSVKTIKDEETASSPPPQQEEEEGGVCVQEIAGEPAILINGVPILSPTPTTTMTTKDTIPQQQLHSGFGEWMEGREVKKLFKDGYYKGVVSEFDKESGWYRVVYEDGDYEDLDWNELVSVLVPLDVSVSLKSLAFRFLKRVKSTPKARVYKSRK